MQSGSRAIALITGASSGIGVSYAEALTRNQHDVILVARRRDRLEELAARLAAETGAQTEVLVADLNSEADLARVEHRLAGNVDLLINNAGFGRYGEFSGLDPDAAESIVRVHVVALVRLTRAVLPGMLSRGRGGIINVASLLAFSGTLPPRPLPHRATYASSKAFMVTFTQTLAGELTGSPLRVQVCLPGVVATEFHTSQGMPRPTPAMAPEDVVTASLKALERGDVICAPGVEDPTVFARLEEAQRAILGNARPTLASRYREG